MKTRLIRTLRIVLNWLKFCISIIILISSIEISFDIATGNIPDHLKEDITDGVIVQSLSYSIGLFLLYSFFYTYKIKGKKEAENLPFGI